VQKTLQSSVINDSLRSIVERTASVYRASDHVGLEICARKLEEHTRMLIVISLSQNSSLGDLFEVLEVSLAMLLRKTSDILNASSVRPKENPPLAFSASTGGRPAYIITKEMIEQLRVCNDSCQQLSLVWLTSQQTASMMLEFKWF
jgi:DNA-binding FrmR family transcriptional regulator